MSVLKSILEGLSVPFNEGNLSAGEVVFHPYKLLYGDLKKIYKQDALSQAIRRAENSGFLKKSRIKGEVYTSLTELGTQKLEKLRGKLRLNIKTKEKEWDGKYRLVLFDIPEENRAIRDLLRNKLKELGFIGWQKSVFFSKEDVTNELRKFFEETDLGDFALVIETKDLGNKKLEYLLNKDR